MNGVHDMGGMHGMGAVQCETDEPVFHSEWEGRVFALNQAMSAWGTWNIDARRYAIEVIPAADYLRMSYYEKWFTRLVELMVRSGQVSRLEVESGRAAVGCTRATPALMAAAVPAVIARGSSTERKVAVAASFRVGQMVRARNMHPVGHTRLPRYVRGKVGLVDRDHGVFVFPDTNAEFRGEKPQHVYSVRFAARELWGEQASPRDAVYVDLWDDYLEPA